MNGEAERPVLVTGDRPTGRLHLGHWLGSLKNRVLFQTEYRCFFLVADLHMLTTHTERSGRVAGNTEELVLDWLSVGMDPERSTFYLQSRIPAISELFAILSMLCSVQRAQRIPTLKEKAVEMGAGESYSLGLLAYPVLMAADILLFKATKVPVGEDQLSHLDLTRELARRFNNLYGPFFPEPEAVVSETPRLVGTDGARKMSKSFGNCIDLSDSPEEVERRVRGMFTDPQRIRADIPGRVEGNPVFVYHDAFNSNREEVEDLKERYRKGRVGDVEVKEKLVRALNEFLDPFRERRASYAGRRDEVREILREGTRRADETASANLEDVRRAIGLHGA